MEVELAPLRDEDCWTLYQWLQVRDYRLDSGGFSFVGRREHEGWFQKAQSGQAGLALGVRRTSDQKLVGLVQLVSINTLYQSAELRIRLDPGELGNGYGTKATVLLCEHAFRDLNLNRIYLHVMVKNSRAVRCYEKVGFQQEGRLRQHGYVDGKFEDFLLLGLLKEDFLSGQE